MTAPFSRLISRAGAALGLVLVALALVLGPATPASAHAVLVSSSPVADTVLTSAPAEVVLTFSESVRKVPDKIRVLGPDGSRVDRGEPTFSGAVVTIPVDSGGARGTYLVSYRVISADSHPVSGAFTYSVGAPSTPPTDTEAGRIDPVVDVGVRLFKYVGYAGLLLSIGPVLVLSLLWPRRLGTRGPARLAWTGIGLLVLATVGGLWLQVPYTNGGGPFEVSGSAFGDVLGSGFGAALLVRLGILAAAAILLRPLFAGRAGRSDQILLTVLGVVGLGTWPMAGHAAASPVPAVSVVVDTVHLAAMAVWLGGLVMLGVFLLRWANDRELVAILPVWSRWATLAVSALLLAGIVQALIEVSTPEALFSTTYGRLLIGKIVLFVLVMGVAAGSRQLVRNAVAGELAHPVEPNDRAAGSDHGTAESTDEDAGPNGAGLDDDDVTPDDAESDDGEPDDEAQRAQAARPGRSRWLRRAVFVELGITAVVLVLSAVLVQTPPARTAEADAGSGDLGYYSTTLTSSIYSLQLEVDPANTGPNSIHLYAYTLDNKPLPVVEWRATAALPERGIEPIEIPMLALTDNHATGEISLPTPGDWQLSFTVRISDIDQATVTSTVPIT